MTEPVIAQKSPCVMGIAPGTYYWCACGRSKKQPFCDGSHSGTEFTPLEVKIEQGTVAAFCACKHTSTPPYCDGTHSHLK
ncbi:MAG: CDGSH iron-sulfur domain-containing protein [Gammaproteobacteria bacterium]|nr:CDGSH iron-sulfur domain-containing protein [Gammaproteobacteria bacterium]